MERLLNEHIESSTGRQRISAIILAAGKGTRLAPLTNDIPKPLIRVGNVPVFSILARQLHRVCPVKLFVNLNYRADVMEEFLEKLYSEMPELEWQREQELTGPAGGAAFFATSLSEVSTVVVASGDAFVSMDFEKFVAAHRDSGAVLTFVGAKVANPQDYGVGYLDSSKKIVRFIEKPRVLDSDDWVVSAGIYCFSPDLLDRVPRGRVYDFGRDLIPLLAEEGADVRAYTYVDFWRDIGSYRALLEANLYAAEHSLRNESAGGQNVRGPVIIGRNVTVACDATIVGPVVLEDNVTIKSNAFISRSLILQNTTVADSAIVLESIVGSRSGS